MKKIIFLLAVVGFLFFLSKISNAQAPDWLWAKSAGEKNYMMAYAVAMDTAGNTYVAGMFSGTTLTFGSVTITNLGDYDIFLVKYDVAGNVIWVRGAGGTDIDYVTSLVVDASGNIYETGYFQSPSITFGSIILPNTGSDDIFLVKYDANGNVLWATSAIGTGYDQANSVVADVSGNTYVTGFFYSPAFIFGSNTLTNTTGSGDIFIAKYDTAGNVLWVKSVTGAFDDYGSSVGVDAAGNSYLAGYFDSYTLSFGSITLTKTGGENIFLAKYDAAGNVQWAKSAAGAGFDQATSIAADASGNTYLAGHYSSTLTFDTTTLTNAGGIDNFLAKYDASGNVLWAKGTGGTGGDITSSVAIDSSGNAYITGYFTSPTLTFGSTTLTNADNTGNTTDLFLVKYSSYGNILWAKSAGSVGNYESCSHDEAYSVAADASGNTCVAGYYESASITFDTVTLLNAVGGGGYNDLFFAKSNPSGNVLFAKSGPTTSFDEAVSVAVDASGNAFVTGYFTSASILFDDEILMNTDNTTSTSDLFLAKYKDNGSLLWVKSAGGAGDERGNSIAVDAAGDIYMAGYFSSSTLTFGSTTLTNAGGDDIFLAKYDAGGNVMWAKSAEGTKNDITYSVAVDASGNSYMAGGFFSHTITFDTTTLTNTGDENIFLVKYDAGGNVVWARSAGGEREDRANSIAVDASGNAYVAGIFTSSTLIFGESSLTNAGSADIFLAKYDTNGNVLWAKGAGGADDDIASSVAINTSGNAFVTGGFKSAVISFDSATLMNTGGENIFLTKYDTDGNVLRAIREGDTGYDNASSTGVDASGNTYITGIFSSSTLTIGNTTLTNKGKNDIFLAKYDTGGNVVWAKSDGGKGDDIAYSLAVGASGNTYVTGGFCSTTLTFQFTTLMNTGLSDIFLAKSDSAAANGIKEIKSRLHISVFPNPAADKINIILAHKSEIEIFNIEGQIVKTLYTAGITTAINIESLPGGVYLIKAKTKDGVVTGKFVKQ